MNARNPNHRRSWRHDLVDVIFLRADSRSETVVGALGLVLWLMLFVLLTGIAVGPRGAAGPVALPDRDGAPQALSSVLTMIETGGAARSHPARTMAYLADPPPEGRAWINANICRTTVSGRAERESLLYYMRETADLCPQPRRFFLGMPLAVEYGAWPGGLLTLVLLLAGAFIGFVAFRFMGGVRRAYRRLYVSEHLAEHRDTTP